VALFSIGVVRASQRPSLQLRAELIPVKAAIMQALVETDPIRSGITAEQYHADVERYGAFLINLDECFLVTGEKASSGLPWISFGAGMVGGYTVKEALGTKGLEGFLSSFLGAKAQASDKGRKKKRRNRRAGSV